jgi:alpha-D-ribose 1-methylphosphonate 5-triphosphate synthase subunit PhnH
MISTLSRKHDFDAVYDSQKLFRLILEATSNPGRAVDIKGLADKMRGGCPGFLAVALTLLDNETGFNACGDRPLAEEIASLTLAGEEGLQTADFIFVGERDAIRLAIGSAKCGTLTDPHKSATVIIRDDEPPAYRAAVSGPGVDGIRTAPVTETMREAVAYRDAQGYEYPQGIDLIFISDAGALTAFPRLTRMEAV